MAGLKDWSTTAADNDDADSNINWLEGQAPSTVNGSARAMMAALKSGLGHVISPKSGYGGVGNGVADDKTAFSDAATAAVAAKAPLVLSGGTWLFGSKTVFNSSFNNLKIILDGATIKKGFSGNLISLSDCAYFSLDGNGLVDGQHGTYTGKGIAVWGSNSVSPHFGAGISFDNFTDSHLEFGPDAGQYAKIFCDFQPGSGQTDHRAIHVNGPDTAAMYRHIQGSTMPGGYIDLDGAQNTIIGNSGFRRVEIDSSCSITQVVGSVWGNGGSAMTISGAHNMIVGNRFAGNVTLDSNFTGVFALPRFTTGKLINNSSTAIVVGDRQPKATIANSGNQTSVSATTSEEALVTVSVPGGVMRTNDALKVTTYWSWTSGADDKTPRIRIGASGAGLAGTVAGSHTTTTTNSAVMETLIQNQVSTSAQRLVTKITTGGTSAASILTNLTSATIDTTADWEVVISGQKETSGDTLTLTAHEVELVRAP